MEFYVLANIASDYGGWTSTAYCFRSQVALCPDDLIVCDTVNGPVLGKVERMIATATRNKSELREVIDTVDMEAWKARQERQENKKKLERAIKNRAEKIEKKLWMQSLAKEDPEIAKLLEELNKLEEDI